MKALQFNKTAVAGGKTMAQCSSGGTAIPSDTSGVASRVALQAQVASIRWTDDGSAPSTTNGFIMITTDPILVYERAAISRLQFTEATGANGAILACTFYR